MKEIKSEMSGTLVEYTIKVGDTVSSGQEVAIVESMKMEVPLESSESGTVAKLLKSPGDFIEEGEVVVELS